MLATDELVRKATTTTSNLSALIPQIWAAQIERNLRKAAVMQQAVVSNTDLLVPGAGDSVYIPILPDLGPAGLLTEGTDMPMTSLSNATSVKFTPEEYGMSVEVTRKALDRLKYDGMAAVIDRLTYAMSQSIEGALAALYNATVQGTSNSLISYYVGGSTSADIAATNVFSDATLIDAVKLLEDQNNLPFDDGFYRAFITPGDYASLMKDADVRQDLRFGSPKALFNGEMGTLHKCRIIVTNYIAGSDGSIKEGASSAVAVHKSFVVAPRWAAIAWKRRPAVVVDPTLYDMGRRRRFGVTADFAVGLLHAERGVVVTAAN